MKANFGIGHIVSRPAFVDCFGVEQPLIEGLKVERIVLVNPSAEEFNPHPSNRMQPYFRILAYSQDHTVRIEAAERFFNREVTK